MNCEDFMFYETFKESIEEFRTEFGDTAAEELALDIIYYGVTGERKSKKEDVHYIHNAVMVNIQLQINKSKEHFERSIQEAEEKKKLRNNKTEGRKKTRN